MGVSQIIIINQKISEYHNEHAGFKLSSAYPQKIAVTTRHVETPRRNVTAFVIKDYIFVY